MLLPHTNFENTQSHTDVASKAPTPVQRSGSASAAFNLFGGLYMALAMI